MKVVGNISSSMHEKHVGNVNVVVVRQRPNRIVHVMLLMMIVINIMYSSSSGSGTGGLVAAQQQNNECTLSCPDNAPCRFGKADFSNSHDAAFGVGDDDDTHRNTMHCDCPIGWTGVLCDKRFESCDNQAGHECFHGGSCLPGLEDKYGNEQLFCDCTSAVSPIDGTQYVGKYCETPFEQVCSTGNSGSNNQQQDDEAFCVNGSQCNPDYPSRSHLPCICEDGWEGYHCEFKTGTVPDCTLNCQNGGTCLVGVFTASEAQQLHHIWTIQQQEDHMRCICPDGYGGYLCESPVEICDVTNGHTNGDSNEGSSSSSSSICLNGGACATTTRTDPVTGKSKTQQRCDCTEATDRNGNRYAGKFCEHAATGVCDDDDFNLFCTQGGVCKPNPIEGCSCPSGTAGYKCEFIIGNSDNGGGGDNDSGGGGNNPPVPPSRPTPAPTPAPEKCGDEVCMNGGVCVLEDVVLEDGTRGSEEVCDCSNAYTDTTIFAGPYCQYKATSICVDDVLETQGSLQGVPFCVHQGECQVDGSCSCQSGWIGEHCELKTFEPGEDDPADEVDSDTASCGDKVCYNGGICVQTEVVVAGGATSIKTHCDCDSAYDEHFLYAGASCEFPSTQLCTVPDPVNGLAGTAFCTNHGRCQTNTQLGCDCPTGFYGFACEFERLNDEDGDGIPNDEDEDFNNVDEDMIDQFDVCDGYDGLICHNSGTCMTVVETDEDTGDVTTIYQCDCSTAVQGDTAYLGERCEYPVTTSCGAFQGCTNGGTCKSSSNPGEAGCDCPNHGFTGLFCQFKSTVDEITNTADVDFTPCGQDLVCLNVSLA
jgi:hypothetical protein